MTRLGLSWFLAFMCWCPDLTIDVHQCPEGRLFIPSESSSKLVRGLHRFRYLWSYTWPKSLLAKIQLILCFAIMISARVCNVLVPYYSKLVVDKTMAFQSPPVDRNLRSGIPILHTLSFIAFRVFFKSQFSSPNLRYPNFQRLDA